MNVLIIGATGKIGSRLLAHLHAKKSYVLGVFVRTPLQQYLEKIHMFEGDILRTDSMQRAIQWSDCVVNCSGKVSYSLWDKKEIQNINITGVSNIVNLCTEYHKSLVHAGSAASYGLSKHPYAFKETDANAQNVKKVQSIYFSSKFTSERIINQSPINSIILRPSSIVSLSGSTLQKLYSIYKKGFALPFQGGFNCVHIEDVVQGFIAAIDRIAQHPITKEIYNLGGHNIGMPELPQYFSLTPAYRIPKSLLWLLSLTDFFSGRFRSPFTFELYRIMQHYCFVDSSKAVNELGYSIQPFKACMDEIMVSNFQGSSPQLKKS